MTPKLQRFAFHHTKRTVVPFFGTVGTIMSLFQLSETWRSIKAPGSRTRVLLACYFIGVAQTTLKSLCSDLPTHVFWYSAHGARQCRLPSVAMIWKYSLEILKLQLSRFIFWYLYFWCSFFLLNVSNNIWTIKI